MTSKNNVNNVNFWFFRHGYSCFNIYKDKYPVRMTMTYKSNMHKDPHLTNWGILGSIMSGNYVNENKLIICVTSTAMYAM